MPNRDRKRSHNNKAFSSEAHPGNMLISSCHDYASPVPPVTVTMADEDFPLLPVTPCKSPSAKKSLYNPEQCSTSPDNAIISTLSKLINERADSLEKLVSENSKKIDGNTLKIEGLKKTLDFACSEIKDTQKKMLNVDARLKEEERKVIILQTRVCEMDSYSRWWNMKLHGVAENSTENVKEKAIEVCQKILSDGQNTPPTAIDVAHRLGKSSSDHSTPRPIIIRFSLRSYRDAVWKSAKNHPFMRDNKLRFAEDLSQLVKDARLKMWPLIKKARSEGKPAYYIGARAFINGQEVT